MNTFEEVAAEYYELLGYYIRRNVYVNKLKGGGYGGEMDVLAYNPEQDELLHIETSGAASSWSVMHKYIHKKFRYSHSDYEKILGHPVEYIQKICIISWSNIKEENMLLHPEIKLIPLPEFFSIIRKELEDNWLITNDRTISENFPLLRCMYLTLRFANK